MKQALIAFFVFLPTLVFAEPVYKGFSSLPESLPIEEGKRLFLESGCVLCHGPQGNGDGEMAAELDPKPRNFSSYGEMVRLPDLQMEQSIRFGRAGTAMPAFSQFTDNQIRSIITFLRSLYAKSYLTINMCVNETYIVDTKIKNEVFKVEADEPDKLQVVSDGKYLHVTAKYWPDLLAKKVYRSHVRVIEPNNKISLIAVRFHNCIIDNKEASVSTPCDCNACKEGGKIAKQKKSE